MRERREIDWASLSLQDLKQLAERVEAEITARRATARRWLQQRSRGGLVEREVRYRNPDNPTQTWSGRGRPPAWVEERLASGTPLDALEAPEDEAAFPAPKLRS